VAARLLPVTLNENLSCIENHIKKSNILTMSIDIKDAIVGAIAKADKHYSLQQPHLVVQPNDHLVVMEYEGDATCDAVPPKLKILITNDEDDAKTAGTILASANKTSDEENKLLELSQKHRVLSLLLFHIQRMSTSWRTLFKDQVGDGSAVPIRRRSPTRSTHLNESIVHYGEAGRSATDGDDQQDVQQAKKLCG
jgi:hypothetical protein